MGKIVCIYQPNVFPPLHYFNRILNSDAWVVLSDVQLNRKVGQTRFSLKVNGRKHTISIPVVGGNRIMISDTAIQYGSWTAKFRKTFDHAYGQCPYFELARSIAIDYVEYHRQKNSGFQQFGEHFTLDILRRLGWQGEVLNSKGLADELKASERMAEIVYQAKGTHYVCGNEGFKQYLNPAHFQSRSLNLIVQDWKCPEYPQSQGAFVPNLSILDLIANVGMMGAEELLVAGKTNGWMEYG